MPQLEGVLPGVQGRQRHVRRPGEYGKMDEVGVKVHDVEAMRGALDLLEHGHMIGKVVASGWVEPQRLFGARYQLGGRIRIAACEERDLMTLPDQFLGEVGDHALGAAI